MGRHGAADGVEHQEGNLTGGGVRLPVASPSHRSFSYEITRMTSFFIEDLSSARKPKNRFSQIGRYNKFVQEFDLGPKHSISPIRFTPGNQIKSALPESLNVTGKNIPYQVPMPEADHISNLGITIDQYGKSVYITRMRFFGSLQVSDLDLVIPSYANLTKNIKTLSSNRILRNIAALAAGCLEENLVPLSKIRTHAHISVNEANDDHDFPTMMTRHISTNMDSLIATHITGDHLHHPHPRLKSALVESNAELNLKSESQLLLLNAQGSTLISGSTANHNSEYTSPYHNRHSRVTDLSEIATAMQHLLINARSSTDISSSGWSTNEHTLERWIRYPSNVFLTSLSNQKLWEVISSSYSLSRLLDEFTEIDSR